MDPSSQFLLAHGVNPFFNSSLPSHKYTTETIPIDPQLSPKTNAAPDLNNFMASAPTPSPIKSRPIPRSTSKSKATKPVDEQKKYWHAVMKKCRPSHKDIIERHLRLQNSSYRPPKRQLLPDSLLRPLWFSPSSVNTFFPSYQDLCFDGTQDELDQFLHGPKSERCPPAYLPRKDWNGFMVFRCEVWKRNQTFSAYNGGRIAFGSELYNLLKRAAELTVVPGKEAKHWINGIETVMLEEITPLGQIKLQPSQWSKLSGQVWNEPGFDQTPFQRLSKTFGELFDQAHPTYRFSPNKKRRHYDATFSPLQAHSPIPPRFHSIQVTRPGSLHPTISSSGVSNSLLAPVESDHSMDFSARGNLSTWSKPGAAIDNHLAPSSYPTPTLLPPAQSPAPSSLDPPTSFFCSPASTETTTADASSSLFLRQENSTREIGNGGTEELSLEAFDDCIKSLGLSWSDLESITNVLDHDPNTITNPSQNPHLDLGATGTGVFVNSSDTVDNVPTATNTQFPSPKHHSNGSTPPVNHYPHQMERVCEHSNKRRRISKGERYGWDIQLQDPVAKIPSTLLSKAPTNQLNHAFGNSLSTARSTIQTPQGSGQLQTTPASEASNLEWGLNARPQQFPPDGFSRVLRPNHTREKRKREGPQSSDRRRNMPGRRQAAQHQQQLESKSPQDPRQRQREGFDISLLSEQSKRSNHCSIDTSTTPMPGIVVRSPSDPFLPSHQGQSSFRREPENQWMDNVYPIFI